MPETETCDRCSGEGTVPRPDADIRKKSLSMNGFSCPGAIKMGKRAPPSDASCFNLFDAPLLVPRIAFVPRAGLVLLAITLASCGGGGGNPPAPVTIPDPISYMAQSRLANGDVTTPLRAEDPITYRRFDFGHSQAEDSFLTGPTSAITTWSYAPWGPFVAANGDGGENYELQGDVIRILSTQDGGAPGVRPLVPHWTALSTTTIDCAKGWTAYSAIERGCRAMINYPGIGPVDTVVSEHRWLFMERIFLGRGWGRLAWQTFRSDSTPPAAAGRCIDFGWNTDDRGESLTDCRYAINLEPADGTLTGAMLWHP